MFYDLLSVCVAGELSLDALLGIFQEHYSELTLLKAHYALSKRLRVHANNGSEDDTLVRINDLIHLIEVLLETKSFAKESQPATILDLIELFMTGDLTVAGLGQLMSKNGSYKSLIAAHNEIVRRRHAHFLRGGKPVDFKILSQLDTILKVLSLFLADSQLISEELMQQP